MTTPDNPRPLQRVLVLAAHAAAIAVGLKYGYDFGAQISGTILGIALAINSAVFCSIAVGTVVDLARRARQGRRPGPQDP